MSRRRNSKPPTTVNTKRPVRPHRPKRASLYRTQGDSVPFSFGRLVVRSSKFSKREGLFRAPARVIRVGLAKRPG
jgi:hypothetical protein